ncbi:hypothetical protein FGADI_4956 [Fusarium gaditjirri]|uniref:C2H2-type domain-containing protein n=1 Tax=Fusarium gaditjirri TaxID=282569 RepID=A0A8H4TBP2_9HYPO|nr:hypothetical protein FGADI_4956 [Fusarium gaditjirri]
MQQVTMHLTGSATLAVPASVDAGSYRIMKPSHVLTIRATTSSSQAGVPLARRHHGQNYSSVSAPQNGVSCPFCQAHYQAASGVVHHLERGCCPNAPLDRDTLYQEVRRRDPNGFVCNKLLEWHGTVSYQATSLAFNSRYGQYECYFCGDLFRQLSSLNQHLASPRHQQELYHCPNRKCLKEFTTLAGMVNHLESESCRFLRFGAVQNGIRGFFTSDRSIAF